MKKAILTKKEQKESVFMTIGRLKAAIQAQNTDRSLALLQKIADRVSQMDIDLPADKREIF
jgi:hypothetical protein